MKIVIVDNERSDEELEKKNNEIINEIFSVLRKHDLTMGHAHMILKLALIDLDKMTFKDNIHRTATLQNFLESIEVYGGIQELFKKMNDISPQYAKELEKVYIEAIRKAVEK